MLDLCDGDADAVTRLFADLGADVLKVEPPGGSAGRSQLPSVAGASVPFALEQRQQAQLPCSIPPTRAIATDSSSWPRAPTSWWTAAIPVAPRRSARHVRSCRSGIRIWSRCRSPTSASTAHGRPGRPPTRCSMRCRRRCRRSGPTAGRPVLPPNGIASATAAVQAAWAALVAYYHRLRYGTGDYIDFSRFEAVVQSLDPPFGSEGQAAVGQKRSSELWRGRPRNQQIYPIFACRDGHVRICLLSARQWRGMRSWLGEPEQFRRSEVRHDRRAVRRVPGDQRADRRTVRRADDG